MNLLFDRSKTIERISLNLKFHSIRYIYSCVIIFKEASSLAGVALVKEEKGKRFSFVSSGEKERRDNIGMIVCRCVSENPSIMIKREL